MNNSLISESFIAMGDGTDKKICVYEGDLTQTTLAYDAVICSAFRNDYIPTPTSLIGALLRNRGISVAELAEAPLIDRKRRGYWLSRPLDGNFRHIGCVEILSYGEYLSGKGHEDSQPLKDQFSMLRMLLEEAYFDHIPLQTIAMPLLGTGDQQIGLDFAVPAIINSCIKAFSLVPTLDRIDIYAYNAEHAAFLSEQLKKISSHSLDADAFDIFISYKATELATAQSLKQALESTGFKIWIAPDSIAAGSDYLAEIPFALSKVSALVLLLSPDAQHSRWVKKEVGSAIGAGHLIFPFQPQNFALTPDFQFLLDGEQIFPAYAHDPTDGYRIFAEQVRAKYHAKAALAMQTIMG